MEKMNQKKYTSNGNFPKLKIYEVGGSRSYIYKYIFNSILINFGGCGKSNMLLNKF